MTYIVSVEGQVHRPFETLDAANDYVDDILDICRTEGLEVEVLVFEVQGDVVE